MKTYVAHMSSAILARCWIALFYSWTASLSWSTWNGCCGYHESTNTAFIQFTERKRKSSVTKRSWLLVLPQFTPKSFIVRERKEVSKSRQISATNWGQTDLQRNLSLVELKIDVKFAKLPWKGMRTTGNMVSLAWFILFHIRCSDCC